MPINLSMIIQAGLPTMTFGSMAQLLDRVPLRGADRQLARGPRAGRRRRLPSPRGTIPLHQIAAKVAPALAAGCTVVLKPSEVAPLNAFILAEIIDEVGLPAGVFNLVTGTGPVVGEAIATHPDVDMVSFTGSTRAGKRVSELASGTVKRIALELGGKSPNVILDDADLERAVPAGVGSVLPQLGPDLLGPHPDDRPPLTAGRGRGPGRAGRRDLHAGRPVRRRTALGPLVSATQRDRVRGYIQKGIDEGASWSPAAPSRPRVRPGLLRAAHGLLRRTTGHDHRPGGDLRAGAGHPALRHRGGGRRHRQRHHLRLGRRRLVR